MGAIPEASRHKGPHAPIFQRVPEPPLEALVTPLCVFAAGRQTFDVVIRVNARDVRPLLFASMPLAENGWDIDVTSIERFSGPVWRVSRGN